MSKVKKKDLEKILNTIYNYLSYKLGSTVITPPSEESEYIYIPTDFFKEVFKKHDIDPIDSELEEFIDDYYIAVKDFVISVLNDDIFQEILNVYGEE